MLDLIKIRLKNIPYPPVSELGLTSHAQTAIYVQCVKALGLEDRRLQNHYLRRIF